MLTWLILAGPVTIGLCSVHRMDATIDASPINKQE